MEDLFVIKPCKSGGTCEVLPKKIQQYIPENVEKALKKIKYSIIASTPFVVIVKREYEFSIFPSGRMLVKELEDKDKIKKLAKEIFNALS